MLKKGTGATVEYEVEGVDDVDRMDDVDADEDANESEGDTEEFSEQFGVRSIGSVKVQNPRDCCGAIRNRYLCSEA